jgi:hypothetical protein
MFDEPQVGIRPLPYDGAIRNPLMGFRPNRGTIHPWATLWKHYIRWNEIEDSASDGEDKIRAFCNAQWKDTPQRNIKIVPRVYLEWPKQGKYWPRDMTEGDYDSPEFRRRLVRLIEKLGAVWDKDPRVAFVEMGLIGFWGEHHSPEPSQELQKILGDAFVAAFPRKIVLRRYGKHFRDYPFGFYWDSFAHPQESPEQIASLTTVYKNDWKRFSRGGECAYDWGDYKIQPGANPTDTVKDPIHRNYLINLIRRLHWNHLGWVADYDQNDAAARAGAELVQKAFGYRFVLEEARAPTRVTPGKPFTVSFVVRNDGATPLYYNWPVEVSLCDIRTRRAVWKQTFPGVDTRTWLPGEDVDPKTGNYQTAPRSFRISGTFTTPASLPPGECALCLAILDPAGMLPAVRFATGNYWRGGRCPLAPVRIAPASDKRQISLPPALLFPFDEISEDSTMRYR